MIIETREYREEIAEDSYNKLREGVNAFDLDVRRLNLADVSINKYDYSAYAIVIDKSKLGLRSLSSIEKDSIFLYTIKELLTKLELPDSDIIIDGIRGPKYTKRARTYLRQELKNVGTKTGRISFEDSRSGPLVQLADLVAGSVARSFTNKPDAKEYIRLFGRKLKKIFKE